MANLRLLNQGLPVFSSFSMSMTLKYIPKPYAEVKLGRKELGYCYQTKIQPQRIL